MSVHEHCQTYHEITQIEGYYTSVHEHCQTYHEITQIEGYYMSVHEHDIEEQTAITLKINMAFFH